MELYAVQNDKGKWLTAKSSWGESWVNDLNDAKVYTKVSTARGQITWYSKRYSTFHTNKPKVVKLIVTDVQEVQLKEIESMGGYWDVCDCLDGKILKNDEILEIELPDGKITKQAIVVKKSDFIWKKEDGQPACTPMKKAFAKVPVRGKMKYVHIKGLKAKRV